METLLPVIIMDNSFLYTFSGGELDSHFLQWK